MSRNSKIFAIVASIVIIAGCLAYAFLKPGFVDASIDETMSEPMQAGEGLFIQSSLSSVTVTEDSAATGVTAHLYGTFVGFGNKPELEITRNGDAVTVRAGRDGVWTFGWNVSMRLDIVIPAGFAGAFNCQSSAGSVTIDCDMSVRSFRAHSSAGAVRVKNIKSSGDAEVSSSAGSVNTGDIEASAADIHSSAGSVYVKSCTAGTIILHSSAGSVTADGLSGAVDANSSAGSVDITLINITGDANITSSAGRVSVRLPANANADIEASTSAGNVSVDNLNLSIEMQKRDNVKGRLGNGGPRITVHSSAGSVEIIGK